MLFVVLAVLLSLVTWVLVRVSITGPMARMAEWTKTLRRGHAVAPHELNESGLFGPIAREVTVLAKSLHRARAGGGAEHRTAAFAVFRGTG